MQSGTLTKKNTAKDPSKKKQKVPFTEAEVDVNNAKGQYETQMFKKLRNQRKKLREIAELEEKIKGKVIEANDAQKDKVASKAAVEAELADVTAQIATYLEQKKQTEKEEKRVVEAARKQAVGTVANLVCLQAVLQKGYSLGEEGQEIAESVGHFTKCLDQFMNKDGGSYQWADELKKMTTQWEKLVLGYKEKIPNTSMSYQDLNEALPGIMEKLPGVIDQKVEQAVAAEPEAAQANGDAQSSEGEAPDEAAALATNFADAFGTDSDEEDAPVAAKVEQPPPEVEKQEEAKVEEEQPKEEAPAEDGEASKDAGDRGRGRRGRGGKWRGGKPREGGEQGEGGYRGKNNRPRTAKPRDADDDDDDFIQVGGQNNQRGRGNRGRGRRGYRGGEGSGRGGRGYRGERGFRGGDKPGTQNGNAEGTQKPADQPTTTE